MSAARPSTRVTKRGPASDLAADVAADGDRGLFEIIRGSSGRTWGARFRFRTAPRLRECGRVFGCFAPSDECRVDGECGAGAPPFSSPVTRRTFGIAQPSASPCCCARSARPFALQQRQHHPCKLRQPSADWCAGTVGPSLSKRAGFRDFVIFTASQSEDASSRPTAARSGRRDFRRHRRRIRSAGRARARTIWTSPAVSGLS
jgi:hypothetical protein